MTELVSGEAVVLDVPVARFPSRVAALLIDMLVQFGTLVLLLIILGAAQVHFNQASVLAVLVTVLVLVFVGYPTTFETLTRGKSLGKMALGLRVVSDDGGPERFRQALVRGLASLVEIWSFSGAPALICSLLSAKGKRLGDLFAGTFVIQERLPRRPGLPPMLAVVPPPLAGWAQTLQLCALQDLTAEQAAGYLRRYWELAPMARDQLGQQIAAAVAAQITPPPPPGTPVLPFLTAVLAVRRHREMLRLTAQRGWPAAAGPAPYPAAPPVPFPSAGASPAQQNGPLPFPAAQHGPAPFPAPAPYPGARTARYVATQPAPHPATQAAPYPAAQPAPYPSAQPAPYAAAQPAPYADGSSAPVPSTHAQPAPIPGAPARSEDQPKSGEFAPPV